MPDPIHSVHIMYNESPKLWIKRVIFIFGCRASENIQWASKTLIYWRSGPVGKNVTLNPVEVQHESTDLKLDLVFSTYVICIKQFQINAQFVIRQCRLIR